MQSINRPELVREHNLEILRRALFLSRRATRQQLSEQTGISTGTLGVQRLVSPLPDHEG